MLKLFLKMDYIGKKFTDLTTGNVVEVKDQFEDVIVLNNNSRLKVNRLLDKSYFDEYIDPTSFFNNQNFIRIWNGTINISFRTYYSERIT